MCSCEIFFLKFCEYPTKIYRAFQRRWFARAFLKLQEQLFIRISLTKCFSNFEKKKQRIWRFENTYFQEHIPNGTSLKIINSLQFLTNSLFKVNKRNRHLSIQGAASICPHRYFRVFLSMLNKFHRLLIYCWLWTCTFLTRQLECN